MVAPILNDVGRHYFPGVLRFGDDPVAQPPVDQPHFLAADSAAPTQPYSFFAPFGTFLELGCTASVGDCSFFGQPRTSTLLRPLEAAQTYTLQAYVKTTAKSATVLPFFVPDVPKAGPKAPTACTRPPSLAVFIASLSLFDFYLLLTSLPIPPYSILLNPTRC